MRTSIQELKPQFVRRPVDREAEERLKEQGVHPLLARLYSSRGITSAEQVAGTLADLVPYSELKNCVEMAKLLADIQASQERILIVSDYDCDGATACSVLVAAFSAMGMNFDYLVPDRLKHGYGLTPSIVEEAAAQAEKPRFIITVDNGISSLPGVERARELGIEVLVTDHHLAPALLPNARLIVNPNQPGDEFPSKDIAGCGVAWYVAWALLDELDARGVLVPCEPSYLLAYVALGTVADVVALDRNNRILVQEGLRLIREGACPVGIGALAQVSRRKLALLTTSDFGFALGPRVNAAGRLSHMSTGIECLTAHDYAHALRLAEQLDSINTERKATQEATLVQAAELWASRADPNKNAIVVYSNEWHEGVVGIVAGRIKELRHRPTFVLCDAQDGGIKGSGRSIPGFHLKHALDAIAAKHPGILLKFGGHAMAAGLTIEASRLDDFIAAFDEECRNIDPSLLIRRLEHDGHLDAADLEQSTIEMLRDQVWGQGFPEPVFLNKVKIKDVKVMGKDDEHLKIRGLLAHRWVDVVAFGLGDFIDSLPEALTIAHKPSLNEYQGRQSVQLMLEQVLEQLQAPEPVSA